MKIKINGYEWKVKFVERNEDNRLTDSLDGATISTTFEMLVLKTLPKQSKKLVLIHELTHAFLCTQGRGNKLTFSQEDVCEFIAYCGEQIIDIADYILDAEELQS